MSRAYAVKNGEAPSTTTIEMRLFCQRHGRMDENGKPIYLTEQSHKEKCNVNKIIAKYDVTGVLNHVKTIEARYGDMTGHDFHSAMNKLIDIQNHFDQLPSNIRKRFNNDPGQYLEFFEDEGNRDEAIKLGLVNAITPAEIDGLGEHVVDGKKVEKTDTKTE